jgi:hypothetical protein
MRVLNTYKVSVKFLPWKWTGDCEQVHYGHRQQNHICWSPHISLTEYNDDKWVADHGDYKVHWDNVSVDENCQIQWPAPFRCIDVVTRLVIEARPQRTDLEEGKKETLLYCSLKHGHVINAIDLDHEAYKIFLCPACTWPSTLTHTTYSIISTRLWI